MDLRYPIDRFTMPAITTPEERAVWIRNIAELPMQLRQVVEGLTESQLDTPYRPDGWTIRQVVHHLADSHMNAFIRLKLALTEHQPVVKTYDEARWAELTDSTHYPVEPSLTLLDALHQRFADLLRSLSEEDLARTFSHPEWGLVRMDQQVALYSWHGRHHVAHAAIGAKRAREAS
ncbi:MAG: YfiT family bacillithiol transferase [Acidobacteriota bacterium]